MRLLPCLLLVTACGGKLAGEAPDPTPTATATATTKPPPTATPHPTALPTGTTTAPKPPVTTGRPEALACDAHPADQCVRDAECAGKPCGCDLATDPAGANVCLKLSNCNTNADCSGACVLSRVPGVALSPTEPTPPTLYGQAWGYFCTTAEDLCKTNADCSTACVYYENLAIWKCAD